MMSDDVERSLEPDTMKLTLRVHSSMERFGGEARCRVRQSQLVILLPWQALVVARCC